MDQRIPEPAALLRQLNDGRVPRFDNFAQNLRAIGEVSQQENFHVLANRFDANQSEMVGLTYGSPEFIRWQQEFEAIQDATRQALIGTIVRDSRTDASTTYAGTTMKSQKL